MLQVGGEFFQVMLSNMNLFGRISICGAISIYNATEKPKCESSHEYVPVAMDGALNHEYLCVVAWHQSAENSSGSQD